MNDFYEKNVNLLVKSNKFRRVFFEFESVCHNGLTSVCDLKKQTFFLIILIHLEKKFDTFFYKKKNNFISGNTSTRDIYRSLTINAHYFSSFADRNLFLNLSCSRLENFFS